MSRTALIVLSVVAVQWSVLSQQPLNKISINELISRWDNRDGAQWFDLAPELANRLMQNDTMFFSTMEQHPISFHSWVDELQYSIFTIYNFKTPKDSIRLTNEAIHLKEQMLSKAEHCLSIPLYAKMARVLIAELKKIEVRFID